MTNWGVINLIGYRSPMASRLRPRGCRAPRRRVEGLDGRHRAGEALDLDEGELAGAALREAGSAGVARQHVRVAVDAERLFGGRIFGVVPGAGRELDDARAQCLAQHRPGQARPALVVESHDFAVVDAASRGVLRMNAHRLAPVDLRGKVGGAEVELAV